MEAALAVTGLEKSYGRTKALLGVDLEIGPGEMLGLLGPNGAGKSTLTKIACGLVRPTGGSARVLGQVAGSAEARRRTGYLAELFRFPGWTMSKGMQQRLGLAQALVGSPPLLLLDEPTSALDPAGRRVVRQVLIELRERGVSALINSHLLTEVERTCDQVAILSHGQVVASGTPDELSHATGVEITTQNGAKRFEDAPREEIPRIISELVAAGERIYEVRPLGSTLEDAYLEVVGETEE
jgi:ABC-2 type transport system ATP-binding protein